VPDTEISRLIRSSEDGNAAAWLAELAENVPESAGEPG